MLRFYFTCFLLLLLLLFLFVLSLLLLFFFFLLHGDLRPQKPFGLLGTFVCMCVVVVVVLFVFVHGWFLLMVRRFW